MSSTTKPGRLTLADLGALLDWLPAAGCAGRRDEKLGRGRLRHYSIGESGGGGEGMGRPVGPERRLPYSVKLFRREITALQRLAAAQGTKPCTLLAAMILREINAAAAANPSAKTLEPA